MIEYSTDLFDGDTIRRLCRHLCGRCSKRSPMPRTRASPRVPLLTHAERPAAIGDWNDTADGIPAGTCACTT